MGMGHTAAQEPKRGRFRTRKKVLGDLRSWVRMRRGWEELPLSPFNTLVGSSGSPVVAGVEWGGHCGTSRALLCPLGGSGSSGPLGAEAGRRPEPRGAEAPQQAGWGDRSRGRPERAPGIEGGPAWPVSPHSEPRQARLPENQARGAVARGACSCPRGLALRTYLRTDKNLCI